MKKLIVILSTIFSCISLSAQIKESFTQLLINPGETALMMRVSDLKTGTTMPGAIVAISHGKDTLKSVTMFDGRAHIRNLPFREDVDTVTVQVSFMGYKPLEYVSPFKNAMSLEALMEEDPEQLSEIIVKADAVAMVVRGDTTIFNSEAFVTMKGDNLGSLLKKLPGISFEGGMILANGKPVSKILLNGNPMFGTNLQAALELVDSDDAKKVRIYDEYDQNRLVAADTLGAKQRVVDVETKNPVEVIRKLSLLAAAGMYTDKNKEGKHEVSGGIGAKYNRFGKDIPSYQVAANLGHNFDGYSPTSTPLKNAGLQFNTQRERSFQNYYNHRLNLSGNESFQEDYSRQVYSPTSFFQNKQTENTRTDRNRHLSASYDGGMGWALGSNGSLATDLSLKYSNQTRNRTAKSRISTDGEEYLSDILNDADNQNISASGGVNYNHFFEKSRRSVQFGIRGGYTRNDGSGHRVDTASATSVPQWVTQTLDSECADFSFNASYNEPISNSLILSAWDRLNGKFSSDKRISFDQILSQKDSVNTYDYHHRDLNNTLNIGLNYNSMNLIVSAGLSYAISAQMRKEHFPEEMSSPRTYQHLSPTLYLNYNSSKFSMSLDYREQQTIPSIEDTRHYLDNSSPLFLRTGNPDLKQSILRSAGLGFNFSFPKISSSLEWNTTFSATQNATAYKTTYFNEETSLPAFGYTASAGSQLVKPVNVSGNQYLRTSLAWSSYVTRIKTNLKASPHYNWSNSPFMTGEELHQTGNHDWGLGFGFNSSITSHFELSLDTETSIGQNLLDGTKVYGYLSENMKANFRANFFSRLWLGSDFNWTWLGTDEANAPGFHRESWNASVSYTLGKKDQVKLGLEWIDILNRNNTWKTSIEENYILSSFSAMYGTSILLRLEWKF